MIKSKYLSVISIVFLVVMGTVGNAQTVNGIRGKVTSTGTWIPENVEELKGLNMGPFVKLGNGDILTIENIKCLISEDQGKTWESYEMFDKPEKFQISNERALLKTSNNVIVLAFMNMKEGKNLEWIVDFSDYPVAIVINYKILRIYGGYNEQADINVY